MMLILAAPNLSDFDSTSLFSLHDRLIDTRPSVVRALGDRLIARNARYPVVMFCTVVMIFAIWGCINIKVDLHEENFLPSTSPASCFLERYRELFGKTIQFLEVVIDDTVEYNVEEIRDSILELLDSAVDTFVPVVNLVFLETDPYKRFTSDISFDRHQTQIVRSRMYLELTQKGVDERVTLVQSLLAKSRQFRLPVSIRAPFTMSLKHDILVLSSSFFIFGVSLVCLFVFSLLLLGQPALTFILVFTSAGVLMETIGYTTHWGVPMNVVTVTVALSANMVASVVAMAFGYSYSVSGKQQMRAGVRIQYTFQATFLPVVFASLVPVITYLPLFAVDAPIITHIWKILLTNSAATLIHYVFFIPNLCLLFSNQLSSCTTVNCTECCCDIEDDSSIYYIPTTARAVHPEGIYQHTSYTYSVPKSIVNGGPPNYLAITGPPIVPSYAGDYIRTHVDRSRTRRAGPQMNESSAPSSQTATPRQQRTSRKLSRDDSIYEAPPSPRDPSCDPSSPHIVQQPHGPCFHDPAINAHQQRWRPFMHPQQYMFYPQPGYRR
uniref:SSD domain-containing protein n=1 Tax=Angiostrongylus cantonensis TaxID=6313 RepID=A0A158P668_ANGCA